MNHRDGIHFHPIFKLGKRPAKADPRNFMFAALKRATVPKVPDVYDFDMKHKGIPTPTFLNDQLGDCVIAGRAHQTLRFEDLEQKTVIPISDGDVRREYFKETGGVDSGLVVLDSLNLWRKSGWRAGKKRYYIKAFTQLALRDHQELKQAVFFATGAGIGVMLPKAALTQFQAGQPWTVVKGPDGKPDPHLGHYVHVCGYNKTGPVCVTWGSKQQMTWQWYDKYTDEAYCIIDARDMKAVARMLDRTRLNAALQSVTRVTRQ
jgi:hypothetical protein